MNQNPTEKDATDLIVSMIVAVGRNIETDDSTYSLMPPIAYLVRRSRKRLSVPSSLSDHVVNSASPIPPNSMRKRDRAYTSCGAGSRRNGHARVCILIIRKIVDQIMEHGHVHYTETTWPHCTDEEDCVAMYELVHPPEHHPTNVGPELRAMIHTLLRSRNQYVEDAFRYAGKSLWSAAVMFPRPDIYQEFK